MAKLDIAVPVNSVVTLSTVVSLDPVLLNWSQSRNIERYMTVSDSSDSVILLDSVATLLCTFGSIGPGGSIGHSFQ